MTETTTTQTAAEKVTTDIQGFATDIQGFATDTATYLKNCRKRVAVMLTDGYEIDGRTFEDITRRQEEARVWADIAKGLDFGTPAEVVDWFTTPSFPRPYGRGKRS